MWKLIVKKNNEEVFLNEEHKELEWNIKSDCEEFLLAVKECYKLSGYELYIVER